MFCSKFPRLETVWKDESSFNEKCFFSLNSFIKLNDINEKDLRQQERLSEEPDHQLEEKQAAETTIIQVIITSRDNDHSGDHK